MKVSLFKQILNNLFLGGFFEISTKMAPWSFVKKQTWFEEGAFYCSLFGKKLTLIFLGIRRGGKFLFGFLMDDFSKGLVEYPAFKPGNEIKIFKGRAFVRVF